MNNIAIRLTYPVTKEYKIANQTLTFCGINENGKDIFSDLGIDENWNEYHRRLELHEIAQVAWNKS